MTNSGTAVLRWVGWRVAKGSGFEVDDPNGDVGLVQIDATQFLVTQEFRFTNKLVQDELVDRLERDGLSRGDAVTAVEDARTFTPSLENPTDLASIPRFVRWFENSYGVHTLAAIIHDQLIVSEPNAGALRSDTVSDRFFRQMLGSTGVPWLKRWIMWAAVALRTRRAAGGIRRISLYVWVGLAIAGITSFVNSVGAIWLGWSHPLDVWLMLLISVSLPFLAAPLWGRQFGASLVAAVAALWILPAAAFALFGGAVYKALEWTASKSGLK
jgi:hypothetical protein